MEHGDNRPIELGKLQASYGAPALLFLAPAAGEYALYGGNEKVGAAKYDLTLVQAHLADVLPKTVEMGKVESVSSAGFKNAFLGALRGQELGALCGARRSDPDPDDRDREALPEGGTVGECGDLGSRGGAEGAEKAS